MGRYYEGDINGKFWFGIQSSNDADFFGVEGYSSPELHYHFCEDDKKGVEEGLNTCLCNLGGAKTHLDAFFEKTDGFNNQMISDHLKEKIGWTYSETEIQNLLEWYARYDLGKEILDTINKYKECRFTAEL